MKEEKRGYGKSYFPPSSDIKTLSGQIISMKLIIFLLISALSFHLPALSLRSDGSGGSISDEEFAISLYDGSLYLSAGGFSYGAASRSGLLRTLSSPYSSSWDLEPRMRPHTSSSTASGFMFKAGPFTAGATTNERAAVFSSLKYRYAEGAMLFAFAEGDDGSLQKTTGTGTEFSTLYLALKGGISHFTLFTIMSFAPEMGFLSMAGAKLEAGDYSISFTYGDILDLYEDDDSYTWGVTLTLGDDGFFASFSYAEGLSPVYSDDSLPRRASSDISLAVNGVELYSSMVYSRSRTGNVSKSDQFALRLEDLTMGWDTDDGLFWEWTCGKISVGFADSSPYLKISIALGEPEARVRLKLALGSGSSVTLSWSS